MSHPSPDHRPDENLREISHLFLSSIRDKAGNGAAKPQRTPPAKAPHPNHSLDLTPEEFAQVFGSMDDADSVETPDRGPVDVPPVVAIIGSHLNGRQFDRAKDYARHLAADGRRIGLIELDASEFRVMCFERAASEQTVEVEAETCFDPRRMHEVLEEMSWDVQRWLLVLPQSRVPEARALIRNCGHWLLLSTCDHDGVISCYRTLKGMTDLWPGGPAPDKPALSLALLDAADEEQATKIADKLVSVCEQFLSWPLHAEPSVRHDVTTVAEHLVMCCRPAHDKSEVASAPQWEIMSDLIARSRRCETSPVVPPVPASSQPMHESPEPETGRLISQTPTPVQPHAVHAMTSLPDDFKPVMRAVPQSSDPATAAAANAMPDREEADVIDLPAGESGAAGETAIVDAVLKHCANELVECPIAPPMCPRARLAVGRDRRIVMLAVSRQGLNDLNTIGQAYQWLRQNQNLIGMAVPQLSIDTQQPPHLRLLVDQADSSAHTLRPMLQGDHVTVKTYRRLRWGGRTGLLLEAA